MLESKITVKDFEPDMESLNEYDIEYLRMARNMFLSGIEPTVGLSMIKIKKESHLQG